MEASTIKRYLNQKLMKQKLNDKYLLTWKIILHNNTKFTKNHKKRILIKYHQTNRTISTLSLILKLRNLLWMIVFLNKVHVLVISY